jgi:hypothetical protein
MGKGGQATFLPINYIYVAWFTSIIEGSQIMASVSSPQAVGINLDGAKVVAATLNENKNTGERSWDINVNGQKAELASTANGRHQPFSVTERVAA